MIAGAVPKFDTTIAALVTNMETTISMVDATLMFAFATLVMTSIAIAGVCLMTRPVRGVLPQVSRGC